MLFSNAPGSPEKTEAPKPTNSQLFLELKQKSNELDCLLKNLQKVCRSWRLFYKILIKITFQSIFSAFSFLSAARDLFLGLGGTTAYGVAWSTEHFAPSAWTCSAPATRACFGFADSKSSLKQKSRTPSTMHGIKTREATMVYLAGGGIMSAKPNEANKWSISDIKSLVVLASHFCAYSTPSSCLGISSADSL